MSKILKIITPHVGYVANDSVAVVPDSHQFNDREMIIFNVENDITLTENDESKLTMIDEQGTVGAVANLATFRSLSTGNEGTKSLHRRKYQYDNGVNLKPDAQDNT